MAHHSHHHNHNSASDGVSQRVNSPRFSGPMTRRAHSFKRNNNNNAGNANSSNIGSNNVSNGNSNNSSLSPHLEIDLPINSPRSETIDGFERESHSRQNLSQRVHGGVLRILANKKGSIGSVILDFGFKERKKLGHWMFFFFCGLCLFLGVFKICLYGWFGSTLERAASNQDVFGSITRQEQDSYRYMGSENDPKRMIIEVGLDMVDRLNKKAEFSGIWSKPNSENFTQCIDQPGNHKKLGARTNGYILINANGGLNQMRFGCADL